MTALFKSGINFLKQCRVVYKTALTKNVDPVLNNFIVFGWRLSDIISLFKFAGRRLLEGQLPQIAGSLTFTTVLALVPLLTIALAIFTVFPLFTTFRTALEAYFIQSLMPKAIAANILGYLNQFASKASRLSAYSAIGLMFTSVMLLATIENVFNQIWKVKHKRGLFKSVMVYWALITLAPLLVGVSLSASSYLFSATSNVVGTLPFSKFLYTIFSIALTTCVFMLLYRTVPNCPIDKQDAAWGGLVAGVLFEIAKQIFAAFVVHLPTYTVVYGALAVVPIFLIWIYTSWLITLFGAVITASLPIVKYERWWHKPHAGSRFVDAMALLNVLFKARNNATQAAVLSWDIREQTRLGFDEMTHLLNKMKRQGWVGTVQIDPADSPRNVDIPKNIPIQGAQQWVLLIQPSELKMADIYRLFVFQPQSQTDKRLTNKVEQAIEQGLQETLESYLLGAAKSQDGVAK